MDETLVCAQATAKVLSSKWRLLILGKIKQQTQRPGELQRALPGLSKKILLREVQILLQLNMINRSEKMGPIRHVQYDLTPSGEALLEIAEVLCSWGRRHPELIKVARLTP